MESLPQKLNVLLTTSLIPFASIAAKLCVVPTGNLYGVIRFETPEAAQGTAACCRLIGQKRRRYQSGQLRLKLGRAFIRAHHAFKFGKPSAIE